MLRTLMILIGGGLITGIKMGWVAGQVPDLVSKPALTLLRRRPPVRRGFDGEKFFTTAYPGPAQTLSPPRRGLGRLARPLRPERTASASPCCCCW